MRLYDSLQQEKREFVPRDGDHVTMYFCGPTVYNYIHLGNARPFVVSHVAKRYFESLGYRVTLVENITDIDDRIIQKAHRRGSHGATRWPRSSRLRLHRGHRQARPGPARHRAAAPPSTSPRSST